jgi:hypothetical protein
MDEIWRVCLGHSIVGRGAVSQKPGRTTVRRVTTKCVTCQKAFKRPRDQKMAPLSIDHMDVCVPFEITGMDVFGPFSVIHGGRARTKRWILLFTCMACRAVHFESLKSMDTQTCINAIARFQARRPGLRKIFCDNGTNFVGTRSELDQAVDEWNSSELVEELRLEGIEWKFGPPAASHWGGVYERLVRSAKNHLKTILTKEALDSNILLTLLMGVESVMNNRPITYVSADSRDPEALTPFNFLCPGVVVGSTVHVIPPVLPGDTVSMRHAWQKARVLVDDFWRRWSDEYILMLRERKKWKVSTPNLRVGQLLLLVSDNRPWDQWRLGEVEDLGTESDGRVRQVRVRLANGKTFRCHTHALVSLELD